ncbi:hypothetical protein E0L36_18965 [Streptomyces sp. AJS327]|uniref:PspA-associated protein PspAB n=1 Tax=Streptomyces sp. AJS327 TaxID=2545265 RepID=UPI0015DE118F|nr:hypothetical protein [Streptomyces sp. AJS327]MBA0052877.1 hypothetical protein [Streptomyces sp. AJS327]
MGFLDSILGRSKPARPDLDQLFSLPSAALTLKAGVGLEPTGVGAVCFASVEGGAFIQLQHEVRELLNTDVESGGIPVEFTQDEYGYTWLLARQERGDTSSLVTDLHAVNSLLTEAGFGPQLLCSLVEFDEPEGDRTLALVYLYKRGSFYPFAPLPGATEKRDNALELQVRGLLSKELPLEKDLSRWFPVWGAPGL